MNLEFIDQRPESGWTGGRPSYRNVKKTGLVPYRESHEGDASEPLCSTS